MAKRTKKKNTVQESTFKSKLVKWLWALVLLGMLVAAAIIVLVSFTKLPNTDELENPKFDQASLIFASDGPEIGRYFSKNREWVNYDQLSPNVVNALVASEDERFYQHSGVDVRGTLRAVLYAGKRGGGSTITQQLAKLFFTDKSRNFLVRVWQKLQEWVIAFEFEKRYTKEEIIAMYLNKYDFLNDALGISAAAQTYFGKKANNLSIQESAVLIGMLQNPRVYNPILYPDNAQRKSEIVLRQMLKNDFIDQTTFDSIRVNPINASKFSRQAHDKGLAPYFRMELKKWAKNLLRDSQYAKSDGGKYNLDSDGLKIYTTIDSRMQAHAEQAAQEHMKKIQKRYFEVWKHDDPWDDESIEISKNLRTRSLKNAVDQSGRYRRLRNRVLKNVTADISKSIENVRLWDTDIRRMLSQKKDDKYFTKMIAKGDMNRGQREVYLQIMKSKYWGPLQKSWNDLQRQAKTEFSKRTKMKVFAYNWSNEKDTMMSPLDSIKYHQMHMQIGSMAIEPQTGQVKTWVGGVGFKYFKYDHITSNRQVGSTFKPFIYTKAIMQGYGPCTQVKDQQYVISKSDPNFSVSKDWAPPNSSNKFTNRDVTLYEGLQKSMNSVSLWLMKQIGNVRAVKDLAVSMGIPEEKIPEYPSICLGVPDLSVMDMTGAYACFANKGIYTTPSFVSRIEDADGRLIYSAAAYQRHALGEEYAYVMSDMLINAASIVHGKLDVEFGGKTGTTNDHVDGWFMGISPNLVVGTWVGGEDRWIRFNNLSDGQGGKMARPYFINFMQKIESDKSIGFDTAAKFEKPAGELGITTDCAVYDQLRAEQLKKQRKESSEDFDEEEFDEEEG